MTTPEEPWELQDAALGAFFLVVGLLLLGFAVLATRNGWPSTLFSSAYFLGAILTLLGGHAIFRGIRGR